MSKHFNMVKDYYEKGLWSLERVKNAVRKGWITYEEYELITGLSILSSESSAQNESW